MATGIYERTKEQYDSRRGKKHHAWKGDYVKYRGLHMWITKIKGSPSKCEWCGAKKKQRYEWSNPSKSYKRILEDWVRLCVSCHRRLDKGLPMPEHI